MKRFLMIPVLLAVLTAALSAGAGRDTGRATVPTYTYMVDLYQSEPPVKDSSIWKAWEKLAGANLDIQWIPNSSYNDKVALSIASNELPNAFNAKQFKTEIFRSAAQNGMFWDVRDAVTRSQNLSKSISSDLLAATRINGKNFFVPKPMILARDGFTYRKDWLEKLGLPKPETVNDFINMARAFATRDPDGNGKNDTFGLILYAADNSSVSSFIPTLLFGGGNGWTEEGGKLTPVFLTQPYWDAIRLARTFYAEGIINQDFATIRQQKMKEMIGAEQAGIFLGNADDFTLNDAAVGLLQKKQAQNPNITREDIWDFTILTSTKGDKRQYGTAEYYFGIVIPKSTNKTQADFEAVFNVFDRLASEEGKILVNFGLEGIHHEIRNGEAVNIADAAVYSRDIINFGQIFPIESVDRFPTSIKRSLSPLQIRIEQLYKDAPKYAVRNPVINLISPTEISRGPELNQILNDAATQYVMGIIDDADLQAAFNRWKASGGQNIIDEYNSAWLAPK